MLDNLTKKRIDDCRDILVGKLPDPKSQIEQITIALIYKFMDDMDREAIDLGGSAKFFSDTYAQYSWDALFDTKVTAAKMLQLYSEAIESMEKNPNIPQLFRNIFKNAYLPYRDPETLKLFLKTIGQFEYTHSEKLGDAFEYLLSVMGSQGDAGQFRTPRHIIDFLVAAVNPGKNDTVLDPACGTAGFLISAFKHIQEKNSHALTPEERKKLIQNFVGYDISPDMVRLSLVNLYLHGFSDPHIWEYDTLSSEERWDESFDVVLANPPFMSPKGGIRPHKKFSISSNRSEVLFVDYIAEHLNPKGRAGIIVPEGVIFQSGTAYKELRKMLVQNYLYAVVSLPAGVFNPYSNVKTSILLIDKVLAKKTDQILFVKIDNDGYNLGSQRSAVKGGQLSEALEALRAYRTSIIDVAPFENTGFAHAVTKYEAGKNGDWNLDGDRYLITSNFDQSDFPLKKLKDITEIKKGTSITKGIITPGSVPVIAGGQQPAYFHNAPNRVGKTITVSASGAYAGFINYFEQPIFASDCTTIQTNEDNLKTRFLFQLLKYKQKDFYKLQKGGAQPHVYSKDFGEIEIPLPPLSIQEEIVAEIEAFQKIIDGAKMVVENYKPKIEIDPGWKEVKLGDISDFKNGLNFSKDSSGEKIKILGVGHFRNNFIAPISELDEIQVNEIVNKNFLLEKGDIVFVRSNGNPDLVGRSVIIPEVNERISFSGFTIRCRLIKEINPLYVGYLFKSDFHSKLMKSTGRGANIRNLSQDILYDISIPLPSLQTQYQIVAGLEKEQALVNANKELIQIFEQKIKARVAKVWSTNASAAPEISETEDNLALAAEPEVAYS